MKTSVLLLPSSALALLALGSVKPACAQWVKGNTYYDLSPSESIGAHTTLSTDPVGTVTLNSVPVAPQGYNTSGYETSGSYSGNVYQDYIWSGGGSQQRTNFTETDPEVSSGSETQFSGPASSSTTDTSGSTGYPSPTSYYDSAPSAGQGAIFSTGDTTTTTKTFSRSLMVSTSATYSGTATATAQVTFGDPTSM
jgi:hypothetical protein